MQAGDRRQGGRVGCRSFHAQVPDISFVAFLDAASCARHIGDAFVFKSLKLTQLKSATIKSTCCDLK
jgi:hypothetical protein